MHLFSLISMTLLGIVVLFLVIVECNPLVREVRRFDRRASQLARIDRARQRDRARACQAQA